MLNIIQRPVTHTIRNLPRINVHINVNVNIAVQHRYYQAARMSNIAAIIPSAKAPIELKATEIPTAGENEVVIRNEAIALNPIDAKLQKLAIFPLNYPATLGSFAAGTIHSSSSPNFSVGDRVVTATSATFRQYFTAKTSTTVKVPSGYKLEDAAGIIGNLGTVVGLYDIHAKLARSGGKGKVLVYGGSSSVGGYGVQYAVNAGYTVVTTSSPGNKSHVESLGAAKVIDHTGAPETVAQQLAAEGPYEVVLDAIGTPAASTIIAQVVPSSPNVKNIWSMLPQMDPSTKLPEGVEIKFASYVMDLLKDEYADSKKFYYGEYLPGVFSGEKKIAPTRMEKVDGGLKGLQGGLDKLFGGVSGVKLWLNPQE